MKKIFIQLARHNLWANGRLIDLIKQLPEEMITQNVLSSFTNLRLTMLHLWNAESVWWQRVKLEENIYLPMEKFNGQHQELCTNWKAQSQQWAEWLEKAPEAALAHEFIYHDSKKIRYKQPVSEVVQHLFLHQSYHRGQLVTILHQLGITAIPSTDFIFFLRKK